jgi:hypothetical protein
MREKKKGEDSQENTSQDVPELYKSNCERELVIGRSMIRNTAATPYSQPSCGVRMGS